MGNENVVCQRNSSGQTALHVAVIAGHEYIVERLLNTQGGRASNVGPCGSGGAQDKTIINRIMLRFRPIRSFLDQRLIFVLPGARTLHGDIQQGQREFTLSGFRSGKFMT